LPDVRVLDDTFVVKTSFFLQRLGFLCKQVGQLCAACITDAEGVINPIMYSAYVLSFSDLADLLLLLLFFHHRLLLLYFF
jgi:hypothetical protein